MKRSPVGQIFALTVLVLAFTSWVWPIGSGDETIEGGIYSQEAPQEALCSGDEFHQFDFWIGEWTVTAGDRTAGHNRITSILGGCVLLEQYEAAGSGYQGSSFNIYDRGAGEWHQSWVDNQGLLLHLRGGLEEGRMVLSGERLSPDGSPVTDQISRTPHEDGTVQQTWRVSSDGGETWQTVFDGVYTRKE